MTEKKEVIREREFYENQQVIRNYQFLHDSDRTVKDVPDVRALVAAISNHCSVELKPEHRTAYMVGDVLNHNTHPDDAHLVTTCIEAIRIEHVADERMHDGYRYDVYARTRNGEYLLRESHEYTRELFNQLFGISMNDYMSFYETVEHPVEVVIA